MKREEIIHDLAVLREYFEEQSGGAVPVCLTEAIEIIKGDGRKEQETMKGKYWIFTFGWGQRNAGRCMRVYGESFDDARKKMINNFGREWAFQYSEDEWKEYITRAKEHGWDYETELGVIE